MRRAGFLLAAVVAVAAPVVSYFEGRSLLAYLDPVGIPTICEGITAGVQMGDVATHEECDALTRQHIEYAFVGLQRCINIDLTVNQWAALSSWAYNVGIGAACSSTLVRMINAHADSVQWCNQLHRWIYADGRVLAGLERRRRAEFELCLRGNDAVR